MSNHQRENQRREHSRHRAAGHTPVKRKIVSRVAALLHFLSVVIYLHPLTLSPTPSERAEDDGHMGWHLIHNPRPQLDETHIMSDENHDVSPGPTNSWTDAWRNDYWGRPLDSESSHKSWRPVSVWSFRFLKGGEYGRHLVAVLGKMAGLSSEIVLRLFGSGLVRRGGNDEGGIEDDNNNDSAERTARSNSLEEGEDETGHTRWSSVASELFVHRFVNVLIHAALAQVVGAVATLLFSNHGHKQSNLQICTRYISQMLFSLHPVHVEAVANAANRPHILALLFGVTIVDPSLPFAAVAVLSALGLLTAETAIFQVPAIALTMTAIRYRELLIAEKYARSNGPRDPPGKEEEEAISQRSTIFKTFVALLPRYALLALVSTTYLLYRQHMGSLSIPAGLIRPAENPFYAKLEKEEWSLARRAMNYSYILSLHVLKSFGIEVVGFSHEYGFDCVPEIRSLGDIRLLLPLNLLFLAEGLLAWSWYGWKMVRGRKKCSHQRQKEQEDRTQRILHVLTFFAWTATLFPVSGVLKVGTFVADRIAVPSTVGTCVFGGRLLAVLVVGGGSRADRVGSGPVAEGARSRRVIATAFKAVAVACLCVYALARRTHQRASEWMDSVPLMTSSLSACPRSIKSNLEMSKIYSGLVPHMLDLEKSLSLISKAQSIDPDYCDVHQQFAHVYFQQANYIPFEEEMVESLMCPFTMGQAMTNWNKYWKVVLRGNNDKKARRRYEKYMKRIQAEVARQEREDELKKRIEGSRTGTNNDEL